MKNYYFNLSFWQIKHVKQTCRMLPVCTMIDFHFSNSKFVTLNYTVKMGRIQPLCTNQNPQKGLQKRRGSCDAFMHQNLPSNTLLMFLIP